MYLMALLSLTLLSLFTLTSFFPHGLLSLALLSLFTLTSYVPHGSTVPGPTVPIHPN